VDGPAVVVGTVAKAHGVRGEVAVEVRSDNPDRFADGATVYLEDGRALTVRSHRSHGDRLLVSFAGVDDRDAAAALRGQALVVPPSMLPPLPEGQWWPHQLLGCSVRTEAGRELGELVDVLPNPANDLWLARDAAGRETLLPAVRDLIVDVDPASRTIVVRDVPGLTVPDGDARG
jgi:16S rRNA processing protein RimM